MLLRCSVPCLRQLGTHGTQDAVALARAVREHERREGAKRGFSEAPGDCLAFKYYRDVRAALGPHAATLLLGCWCPWHWRQHQRQHSISITLVACKPLVGLPSVRSARHVAEPQALLLQALETKTDRAKEQCVQKGLQYAVTPQAKTKLVRC